MLTMIITTFLVGEFNRPEPFRLPLAEAPASVMASYALTAAEIYERDGQTALAGYLAQIERRTNMRSVLYGPNFDELSGRYTPDGALELAHKASETRKTEVVRDCSLCWRAPYGPSAEISMYG